MEIYLETLERPIHLRSFLSDYQEKLPKATGETEEVPFFFSPTSPVSVDVEKSCSLDLISSPDENCIHPFQPGAEIVRSNLVKPMTDRDVPKLYTALSVHKENSRKNSFGRTQFSYRLVPPPSGNNSVPGARLLESPELLITVRFYRPARATHRGLKLESPVFAEEFVCLGSTYLTELRDKIFCICNGKRFVDISKDPDAPLPTLETNPGYFFIYDTFYNDKRNPDNCDYSETVLQWAAKAQGLQGEQFKVENMESTRIIDLTVRPGAPLHYLHHGNCEHLFVFSQIEVLPTANGGHLLDHSLYPYVRATNNYNRRSCYMCGLRGYEFIVEKSLRQLHDPSYLCRRCFLSFHYVNGEKVGQFKAYRIYDRPEALNEDGKNPEDGGDSVDLEST
ncbi:snRNA-activating protein complex subunit 3 [Drosophila pseudoobscura]|uniref:snRNA-activating protein complex subunit 3 n=1 Tax=Drosophila pseudoobscura pseudoobscura TaxID=46245 RepID=A0A6I8UU47_DROPS|nr:snRNA-activating protein complex subunit 3 [Drosophila pseudoobscura]